MKSIGLAHVFLQGYYMPPIFEVYEKHKDLLGENLVIRLHGPNREDIEQLTGNKWGEIVDPRDNELDQLKKMIAENRSNIFIFVNNLLRDQGRGLLGGYWCVLTKIPSLSITRYLVCTNLLT